MSTEIAVSLQKKKKDDGVKKKLGRPTIYDPKYCAMVIEHMEKGFSFESFAGVVSTTKQTIYEWAEKFPEFGDAKKIAEAKCQIFWEELGMKHIITQSESWHQGGSKSSSLNASVWIFNMKNRFKWRDQRQIELEDKTKPQEAEILGELGSKIVEALKKING
jgi:hypothetical protein